MAKPKKARRGRPPVPVADQRRNKISVRVRDDLLATLETWAKMAGRTLSEQCEFILQGAVDVRNRGGGHSLWVNEEIDRLRRDYKTLAEQWTALHKLVDSVSIKENSK